MTGQTKNGNGAELRTVWRRTHRPEEYATDAGNFVADELRIPRYLVIPFSPLIKSLVKNWENAAVETTALSILPSGNRILRTFFDITNYSSETVYKMLEKILRRLGVGASFLSRHKDTDFAWVLLGGILGDYGKCAGLNKKVADRLIDFRFPLSDYFTAVTWFENKVEIANLKTGRVDYLEMPPSEIKKIVDWTIAYENNLTGCKIKKLTPGIPEYSEYSCLEALYRKTKGNYLLNAGAGCGVSGRSSNDTRISLIEDLLNGELDSETFDYCFLHLFGDGLEQRERKINDVLCNLRKGVVDYCSDPNLRNENCMDEKKLRECCESALKALSEPA